MKNVGQAVVEITINEVLEEILNLVDKEIPTEDFASEIITAFAGYEFDGEDYVYVGDSHNEGYDTIAYINKTNAPSILMKTEQDGDNIILREAWVA